MNISSTCILLFSAIASAALLSVALGAQYGFHLAPCHLCLLQRYPYLAIIIIGLIGCYGVTSARTAYIFALCCVLLFYVDAAIAFYHSGVEAGWFPGPSGCTNSSSGGDSLEEMRAQIMNATLVPCDQPMAHILGLSLAGWNTMAALLMAFTTTYGVRKIPHG